MNTIKNYFMVIVRDINVFVTTWLKISSSRLTWLKISSSRFALLELNTLSLMRYKMFKLKTKSLNYDKKKRTSNNNISEASHLTKQS